MHYILVIAILAFKLNFVWELVQGPLYEGYEYDWQHISICALASVVDMLMIFLLLFGFAIIYKSVYWIKHLTYNRIITLMLVGAIGAILAEIWHRGKEDWSYSDAMPELPVVNAGLSPVLQFTILPIIIFTLSNKIIRCFGCRTV